jgi:tetratricopeptide (TPR) repeat protein
MFGEQYRRAIAVMRRMIAEMDEGDVVTVLACHAECEPVLDGFSPPSLQLAESAYRKLEASAPEGASDLIETIRSASELVRQVRDRDARVVLIGDGSPTVGAIHPAFIRSAVSQLLPNQTTVSAVTVGADADLAALQAVTETAGGSVLQYSPGQSVAEVAYDALAFTYGRGLRNAQLILPEGLTQVAPSVLGTIPAGGEALVVARMPANNVRGKVVLRGTLGDQRFEQSYDLELTATSAAGNAFVPRVFAATHIAELDRSSDEASRRQSVALSGRYNVASRYTSLLVLESPAMFKAFGLDNERRVAHWTGEEDAEGTSAEGDVGFETDEASADGDLFDKAKGSLDNPASGVSSGFDRAPSAKAKSPSRSAGPADESLSGGRFAPPPASAPRAEKPTNSCPPWDPACQERESDRRKREVFPPRPPPRQLIPMRRVWERTAEVNVSPGTFDAIREDKIRELSRRLQDNALDRSALKELYSAYLLAGDLGQATELAERWSAKDPMDIDALTARADLAAQRGDRRLAIRILGSVVDVRPGEHKAQWRLARLHRWAGRPEQGCSHSVAVAQIRPGDARLLSEALRCTRATGQDRLMADLGRAVTDNIRRSAEQMLNSTPSSEDALSGDFRLEADWSGAEDDLDLVLIHPDGYRVSWLGAPTRAVISATDVLSVHREGLALRGAEVGEYAVEVVRANPSASPVRGNLRLRVGSRTETIPFYLEGTRSRLARVKLRMQSSLVPL